MADVFAVSNFEKKNMHDKQRSDCEIIVSKGAIVKLMPVMSRALFYAQLRKQSVKIRISKKTVQL